MTNDERKLEALDCARAILAEFFESAQILATTLDEEGDTEVWEEGFGNQCAREGAARKWLRQIENNEIDDMEPYWYDSDEDGEEYKNG